MEEARLDFLEKIGYPMTRIEADGITSPVVSIKCDYKRPSTFGNKLEIEVSITQYTGVKLTFSYIMKNIDTNETVAIASSVHCFLNPNGKPVPQKVFSGS
jgi:acyl-CoA thioester hydrolase